MTTTGSDDVEHFHATSGRATGWMTVVLAALLVVAGVAYRHDGFPDWVVAGALLVGVLGWASMLRPALWVRSAEVLVMQNMLETVEIRLAAVEELALRQVLAVRAADRRWVSPVVGRTWRKAMTHKPGEANGPQEKMPYADYVEDRLRLLVDEARGAAGVRAGSPEQLALSDAVRRQPAWLPIALIAASALALVLAIAL